jgi:hypothetical protein
MSMLINGGFENGWYHPDGITELQIPKGWTLEVTKNVGASKGTWLTTPAGIQRVGKPVENPYDKAEHSRFMRPEVRVMTKAQVPDWEEAAFGMEGGYILKAFKGNGSLLFAFMQSVQLEKGEYELTIRVYPDTVSSYNINGKVFANNSNAALIRFGEEAWTSFNPVPSPPANSRLQTIKHTFDAPGGMYHVKIGFMLPFHLAQNGILCDRWELNRIDKVDPEPPVPIELKQNSRLGTHSIVVTSEYGNVLKL